MAVSPEAVDYQVPRGGFRSLRAQGETNIQSTSGPRVAWDGRRPQIADLLAVHQSFDERTQPFQQRARERTYPCLWLDETYLKMQEDDCGVSMALVVGTDVAPSGDREIMSFDIGLSEEVAFRRSLVASESSAAYNWTVAMLVPGYGL